MLSQNLQTENLMLWMKRIVTGWKEALANKTSAEKWSLKVNYSYISCSYRNAKSFDLKVNYLSNKKFSYIYLTQELSSKEFNKLEVFLIHIDISTKNAIERTVETKLLQATTVQFFNQKVIYVHLLFFLKLGTGLKSKKQHYFSITNPIE